MDRWMHKEKYLPERGQLGVTWCTVVYGKGLNDIGLVCAVVLHATGELKGCRPRVNRSYNQPAGRVTTLVWVGVQDKRGRNLAARWRVAWVARERVMTRRIEHIVEGPAAGKPLRISNELIDWLKQMGAIRPPVADGGLMIQSLFFCNNVHGAHLDYHIVLRCFFMYVKGILSTGISNSCFSKNLYCYE